MGSEVSDLALMLGMLDNVYFSPEKSDVRLWKPDVKCQFSVKSFYNVLVDNNERRGGGDNFWISSIPPRVLVFCWIARNHKILTIDHLRKRNHIIVNGCPLCLNDEEMMHRLLIHCPFAHDVWSAIINMFDINWVMPGTIVQLSIQWRSGCKFYHRRFLWITALYGIIWKLWLEINNRVFWNNCKSVKEVVE